VVADGVKNALVPALAGSTEIDTVNPFVAKMTLVKVIWLDDFGYNSEIAD
jgi:hypothetical protein